MARAGVSNPNHKSVFSDHILQISDPLISPPAPPRIPPGRPKKRAGLIFVIFISLGTGRAKCKKSILDGSCYEYAPKMQASRCLFYAFHVSTHFLHHMFSKLLFLLERVQHFSKTTSSDFNEKVQIFDPQTASIRAFFVI